MLVIFPTRTESRALAGRRRPPQPLRSAPLCGAFCPRVCRQSAGRRVPICFGVGGKGRWVPCILLLSIRPEGCSGCFFSSVVVATSELILLTFSPKYLPFPRELSSPALVSFTAYDHLPGNTSGYSTTSASLISGSGHRIPSPSPALPKPQPRAAGASGAAAENRPCPRSRS